MLDRPFRVVIGLLEGGQDVRLGDVEGVDVDEAVGCFRRVGQHFDDGAPYRGEVGEVGFGRAGVVDGRFVRFEVEA